MAENINSLEELGEFGLIEHLTQSFEVKNSSTKKSIGDDSCVLDSGGKQMVVSTDMLVEGVHFNLTYMPLKHLGYKAVVVNLSDVLAMNVVPTQITFSLAVSNRFPVDALEELYVGVQLACKKYGVDLVGGDTTSSTKGMILSVTAIGFSQPEKISYRSGAKPNELVVVSGDLGAAYLGYQILERENQTFLGNPNHQPELESYTYLVERQLKPEARKDVVELLDSLDLVPTSMIDVSDGLASECLHLSKQSGVSVEVFEDKIPLDPMVMTTAEEFNLNPSVCALNGGEDYELLFTLPLTALDKIKNHPLLTVVGRTKEKDSGNYLIGKGNQSAIELTAQGWNAFHSTETHSKK